MSNQLGYLIFMVVPGLGTLLYTLHLAYYVSDPAKTKTKLAKYKTTPRYSVYKKFYNKQFLAGWVCITLFFISRIAYDVYRASHKPPTAIVFFMLILTLTLIFLGGSLISKALKK